MNTPAVGDLVLLAILSEYLLLTGRRCPSIADRQILPYTEACLYETMRAGVIAGLGLPHLTICDTSVGMYSDQRWTSESERANNTKKEKK
jgi:hypothetical protein